MSGHDHTHGSELARRRGLLERALPVLGPRLERQTQPAARRRSGRSRARPCARRRVRRGRRRHLAGPARLGCRGDRHLERRPRAWGAARASRPIPWPAHASSGAKPISSSARPSGIPTTSSPRSSCSCRPSHVTRLFTALAASVRTGGALLVVGHDPSDMTTGRATSRHARGVLRGGRHRPPARCFVDGRGERGPAAVGHLSRGCRRHGPRRRAPRDPIADRLASSRSRPAPLTVH